MSDQPPEQILKNLQTSIVSWTEARKDLTAREQTVIGLRAGLELIPFGIGAALSEGYFGTLDARRSKKIEETLRYVCEQVSHLHQQCAIAVTSAYFATDQFASLFEECWRRILAEAQQAKLQALRSALVSVIVDRPKFDFAKREFFIKSLDGMADTHIQILQVFRSRFLRTSGDTFETQELWNILRAKEESQRDYVYAALDVLANRRYIEHRSIPQVEEGRIDFARQRFRLTRLGAEFLDFVRLNESPA